MKSAEPSQSLSPAPADDRPRVSRSAEWTLHEYTTAVSTNLVAARLPLWSAVRADTQTGGRGRFERQWVSDSGGLWLSAVVPAEPNTPAWPLLPLATGLAVCEALQSLVPVPLRLRWPNDVLVADRKLAGLLIDHFAPHQAVVGLGVNVTNRPEELDPTLTGRVARLADFRTPPPTIGELAGRILTQLASVLRQLEHSGPAALLPRINALWQGPRQIRVECDRRVVTGRFSAVDSAGRLVLEPDAGPMLFLEPQQVRLLREIESYHS